MQELGGSGDPRWRRASRPSREACGARRGQEGEESFTRQGPQQRSSEEGKKEGAKPRRQEEEKEVTIALKTQATGGARASQQGEEGSGPEFIHIEHGHQDRWHHASRSVGQKPASPFRGHGAGQEREDPAPGGQKGETSGQEEEGRESRELQQELLVGEGRGDRHRPGGGLLRGCHEGAKGRRELPGRSWSPLVDRHEKGPPPGSGTRGSEPAGDTYRHTVFSSGAPAEEQWPGSQGATDTMHSATPWQSRSGSRLPPSTSEVSGGDHGRVSLERFPETGNPPFGSSDYSSQGGVAECSTGSGGRRQDEASRLTPGWEVPWQGTKQEQGGDRPGDREERSRSRQRQRCWQAGQRQEERGGSKVEAGSWDREPYYEGDCGGLRLSCAGLDLERHGSGQEQLGHFSDDKPAGVFSTVADEVSMSGADLFQEFPPRPPSFHGSGSEGAAPAQVVMTAEKSARDLGPVGSSVSESGSFLVQKLLEVLPLRSKSTGKVDSSALLPLPTSRHVFMHLWPDCPEQVLQWVTCVCLSLNSFWGELIFADREPTRCQKRALEFIKEDVTRFCELGLHLVGIDWDQFFMVRGIDYKGDEVRVARKVSWASIAPALPKEIGAVPLEEVCTLGCREYVRSFDGFIKPREQWGKVTRPKVMVDDADWPRLCTGLLEAGVCTLIEEEQVFQTDEGPLLNGLFAVGKEEWTDDGTEICRLIMNLVPLNAICQPLSGDVDTLPSWGMMNPYFLQPGENLLVSSEDVKCFFYTMRVPDAWVKYLSFNKCVPDVCLPKHMRGQNVYLASRVLPMGFLNSVSLAQNVHRNLVKWACHEGDQVHHEESELRKDRPFTVSSSAWRVYLDNYDLLEKVQATGMVELEGTTPVGVLALRSEYLQWQVPRNAKKGVSRSAHCELQGATVDGVRGLAFPKESKLSKYYSLALKLLHQPLVTQRQLQVVCGGFVYFAMFRRPTLGALNAVWRFIESFNEGGPVHRALPPECRLELLRFMGMLPLIRMNFRLEVDAMATCSDASTTGGGVCCSRGLTPVGHMAASGELRGRLPRALSEHMVLVIGLFDGIGALRVAVDLQGVQVVGYISVEKNPQARRVVESHYPGVEHLEDVAGITPDVIKGWSLRYSQCSLVLVGAGPPCQGVSGLNTDRRGALKDERSCLFSHVPRIRDDLRMAFPWAAVHVLMESVSSMDAKDRDIMSQGFGGQPVQIDAGEMTWCHRPRLYWTTWDLVDGGSGGQLLAPGGWAGTSTGGGAWLAQGGGYQGFSYIHHVTTVSGAGAEVCRFEALFTRRFREVASRFASLPALPISGGALCCQ